MATVPYTVVQPGAGESVPTGVSIYEWNLAGATDDGAPVMAPQYSGKVVQKMSGAGVVSIQVSLNLKSETPTWGAAHSPDMVAISLAAADFDLYQVLEDCVLIRPLNSSAGTTVVRLAIVTSARR